MERQRKALELRKAGASFDVIASSLGYKNRAGAYKAVQSLLQRTLREPADELRTLEAERLDRLLMGVWKRAITGDAEALDRVLKIMDRRSKLLGLDIPPPKADSGPFDLSELTSEAERASESYVPDKPPEGADPKAAR